ncbi:MAG: dephospho-CoA kinase, partial [Clostridia bacterium]|nr:dephospho-CoA kinase [Clostridia bacterium]
KIAFSSPEKTRLLNDTIFPFIKELVLKETEKGNTLLDAPTLFESGLNKVCFKTVAILADKDIRLQRIIKRDNLTEEEALLRMNAGKDDAFYIKNADYIIYNNNGEVEFLKQFETTLTEILQLGENL